MSDLQCPYCFGTVPYGARVCTGCLAQVTYGELPSILVLGVLALAVWAGLGTYAMGNAEGWRWLAFLNHIGIATKWVGLALGLGIFCVGGWLVQNLYGKRVLFKRRML